MGKLVKTIASIPAFVLSDSQLSPRAKVMYGVLSLYTEEDEPNVSELARRAGVSRRWAQHTIRELEDAEYLVVETKPGGKNSYCLIDMDEEEWQTETSPSPAPSAQGKSSSLKGTSKKQNRGKVDKEPLEQGSENSGTSSSSRKLSRKKRSRRMTTSLSNSNSTSTTTTSESISSSVSEKESGRQQDTTLEPNHTTTRFEEAEKIVDTYLGIRKKWSPRPEDPEYKYTGAEVRQRAIRSVKRILVKKRATTDEMYRLIEFVREDQQNTEFPYKVSNFFGQKGYWNDAMQEMKHLEVPQNSMINSALPMPNDVIPLSTLWGTSAFQRELDARMVSKEFYKEDIEFMLRKNIKINAG